MQPDIRFPDDQPEETPEVPTYGYRCERCGHEFDVFQRMSDEAGADCPSCGAKSRRLFFPAGIVFKGSGFYKTDSRGAGADSSSSSSSSTSTPSTKKSPSDGGGSTSTPTPAGTAGD